MVLSRIRCAVLAALMLCAGFVFSGCAGEPAKPDGLGDPCRFDAKITKDDQSFEASFERDENGGWTAVFVSPESLNDMEVRSFAESCEIRYGDLTLEMEPDKLPANCIASAIEGCIDHAAKSSSAKVTDEKDARLLKGEAGCGEYELRVGKSGEILSLYVGTEISAEFSGYEKLS